MVLKCLHRKFYHKIEKRVGQGVSTIKEKTNAPIAIIIDLQKVNLMRCLMVGSKVLHNKIYHKKEERIGQGVSTIYGKTNGPIAIIINLQLDYELGFHLMDNCYKSRRICL